MQDYLKYVLIILFSIAPSDASAQLITVNGPIEPEEVGLALIHEHIMVDWIGADSTGRHRWDRDAIVARALPYLEEVKEFGVTTFLDCTPAYLGRDPYVLKKLADRTGIQILTNTGYYGSGNNKYIPKEAMKAPATEIASHWIKEFEHGIDGSGIRPGFIKISVENEKHLSEAHRKLITAAGIAHLETGMAIVSHTGGDSPAMAQIRVLKGLGVSPSAFVWTHAQNGSMSGYVQAADQGAWISLDNINGGTSTDPDDAGNVAWFVETLLAMKNHGFLDHVLISHDAGWYTVGEENGGSYRGYTDLFTKLIPQLERNGFTQGDIDLVLRQNPRKAYAIQVRKE